MTDSKDDKKQKSHEAGLDKIKSSVLSRSLTLAKLTLNAGAKLASHSIANATTKDAGTKEDNWRAFIKSQAGTLSQELGELKGSLMKAGQMLSMYGEHFFPPEANELLKSLQQDSPPLKWSAIEPIIIKHLGKEKMAELEIEQEALACASMGQVHRARVKATQELICLKIQYPDVDKAIESDLRAIRTLLNVLKLLPKDVDLDPIFDEVKTMLYQECDYEQEARLTQEYTDLLGPDPRFVIPKIYPYFSSKKIIASSFERGLRVDDPLIQNLSLERRNKIGSNFLDLYFKELFEWGLVQTDPHNGNYKIRLHPNGQDQIVLFDFGATRRYDESFLGPYRQMVKGSLLNEKEAFNAAAQKMGFINDQDHPRLKEIFEEFCFETVEPFLDPKDPRNNRGQLSADGDYDWKNTDLPNRLSSKVLEIVKNFSWRTPPKEIIFLDRKTGGVFIFLSVLKAKMNGRKVLMPYIEKI